MFREKQKHPAYFNSDISVALGDKSLKYFLIFDENIPQEIKSLLSYKPKIMCEGWLGESVEHYFAWLYFSLIFTYSFVLYNIPTILFLHPLVFAPSPTIVPEISSSSVSLQISTSVIGISTKHGITRYNKISTYLHILVPRIFVLSNGN